MVWARRIALLLATLCTGGLIWGQTQLPPMRTQPVNDINPRPLAPQPKLTGNAWTYDEAMEALGRHPDNAYLHYVVLQLARNQGKLDELRKEGFFANRRQGRQVDLFNLFTGTHAIQESLQLDAMLPADPNTIGLQDQWPPRVQGDVRTVQETHWKEVTEVVPRTAKYTVLKDGKTVEMQKTVNETVVRKVPYTVTRYVTVTKSQAAIADLASDPRWLFSSTVAPWAPFPATFSWVGGQTTWPNWPTNPVLLRLVNRTKDTSSQKLPLADIAGPTPKSHPWEKLLAGRSPKVSPLAKCVPEDFYLAEFRSVNKLLDVLATGQEWAGYLFPQAALDATDQRTRERMQTQLLLQTPEILRPFFDQVVERVAVTGSDIHVKEGSDVTFLFQLKQPALFRAHTELSFAQAQKATPAGKRMTGEILGVKYTGLVTPDRLLSVYVAEPKPDLHVRSNSLVGLRGVLLAIQGKNADGKPMRSLGASQEFQYIRTLWPDGAAEEDGLVYFSDAFVRHMVGPQLKLAERRRLVCYNHLRMIGHAAQLYRTQFGITPGSLDALVQAQCCPGTFNEGDLKCPCGGKYTLSADGMTGVCSVHGTIEFLTPCCELPLKEVAQEEADAYKGFIDNYNEYWRTYFDPIAVRVQNTPKKLRVETMVLPLIDKSIYTDIAKALGGKSVRLGAQPVAKRNLFSMHLHFNGEELLNSELMKNLYGSWSGNDVDTLAAPYVPASIMAVSPTGGIPGALPWHPLWLLAQNGGFLPAITPRDPAEDRLAAKGEAMLKRGIGDQLGVHLYDTPLTFDINFSEGLGGLFNPRSQDAMYAGIGVLAAGFFTPYYVTLDVRDTKVVDEYLEELERYAVKQANDVSSLGALGSFDPRLRFFGVKTRAGSAMRAAEFRLGPWRYHIYWARLDNQLVITNQPYVFDDLRAAAKTPQRPADVNNTGHALIRFRPENWNQALTGYQIGWAANNREACVKNLGILSGTARAFDSKTQSQKVASWDDRTRQVLADAAKLHGVHCACPDGGRYELAKDGRSMTCGVHGSADSPQQNDAPAASSPLARLMRQFADLSATLTFREEGLNAVLVVEKK